MPGDVRQVQWAILRNKRKPCNPACLREEFLFHTACGEKIHLSGKNNSGTIMLNTYLSSLTSIIFRDYEQPFYFLPRINCIYLVGLLWFIV